MTPEAQRIAIAEACGWRIRTDGMFKYLCRPGDVSGAACGFYLNDAEIWPLFFALDECGASYVIPDYLTDLNAMHEAEKVLDDEQLADMAEYLGADADDAPAHSWRILLRATAAQRAEAFLKTIGKWEKT